MGAALHSKIIHTQIWLETITTFLGNPLKIEDICGWTWVEALIIILHGCLEWRFQNSWISVRKTQELIAN